jgi:hypothetical protein
VAGGVEEAGHDGGRHRVPPVGHVSPITAAEAIDPIAYRTTDRSTTLQFALMSGHGDELWPWSLNGATTTVTGATDDDHDSGVAGRPRP